MRFVPVPGLELAGSTLLRIWDAVDMVEVSFRAQVPPFSHDHLDFDLRLIQTNRLASLRLTERCADTLISVREEIADAGFTVAEELHGPIAKLNECGLNLLRN